MSLILDAGGFVALERDDGPMWRRFRAAVDAGDPPVTHGGVVGQVWRGGRGRQARLARALQATVVVPLTGEIGRAAGLLLRNAGASDVIDAAVVLLASEGDTIVTSDVGDIERLIAAADLDIVVLAT
jgi:hypothetical protein